MRFGFFACISLLGTFAVAQDNPFAALQPRSVGPVTMGGRTSDIEVVNSDPRIYYLATAGGGVWKTINGGITFNVVFDKGGSVSMGSVSVCQGKPDVVFIGTGEVSSRNSVAWGDGVYKSVDAGKTWTHVGLRDTKHIGKVIVHPNDPNTVVVGALGHLWGPNKERGVYRSTDGGKTWQNTLFIDENTGIVDMAANPKNPNELLAAAWQRRRKAYNFEGGGAGSGLYKSTDGGKSWRKISKGLPQGPLGRIGLSYFEANPKVVIATVERPPIGDLKNPGETPVASGGIFKSVDGGESWKRLSILNPRAFYFSVPRQDPVDENRIYIPGVSLAYSDDGGKSFRTADASFHSDVHDFWIDPRDNNHVLVATDGGLYQSRDRCEVWEMLDRMPIGQFYDVHFDMRKPYWVYGGLQDNGSWGSPTQTVRNGIGPWDAVNLSGGDGFHVQVDPEDFNWVFSESQGGSLQRTFQRTGNGRFARPTAPRGETYRFNWSSPILLSPHSSKTVYFGGNRLFRSTDRGVNWAPISPDLTTNDREKQKVGLNSVSPEATSAENHCTIITISESPMTPGLIYVGTDDGLVQVTSDNGATWTDVTKNIPDLPANTWCSRVTASGHVANRVYATFDGHRNNDYKAHVYVSEDKGATWKKLSSAMPENESCYVITEGLDNPNLLFVGTEMGLWISTDRGEKWTKFKNEGFPTVAVHDAEIHPRERDLILATHGRSIYTMDISVLEDMTDENMRDDVFVAAPQNVYLLGRTNSDADAVAHPMIPNTAGQARIFFWTKSAPKEKPTVRIERADGSSVTLLTAEIKAGIQSVVWRVSAGRGGGGRGGGGAANNGSGDYRIVLTVDGKTYITSIRVEDIAEKAQGG